MAILAKKMVVLFIGKLHVDILHSITLFFYNWIYVYKHFSQNDPLNCYLYKNKKLCIRKKTSVCYKIGVTLVQLLAVSIRSKIFLRPLKKINIFDYLVCKIRQFLQFAITDVYLLNTKGLNERRAICRSTHWAKKVALLCVALWYALV